MKTQVRIGGLDGLRAAAIVSVLCLHAAIVSTHMPPILRIPCLYGWAGVDLFFVLSGYLIGGQVFISHSRIDGRGVLEFWLRRWFRTLPLYYFVLCIYVMVLPRCGFPFHDWNWRYLVMMQNYMPLQGFQQSWSLCIEEQFYLAFPILAMITARLRFRPWVWLIPGVVSLILRWSLIDPAADRITAQYAIRFPIYTHMDGLSVGVFLAATRSSWRDLGQAARGASATGGMIALLGGLALLKHPAAGGVESVLCYSMIAIGFGGLLIACADLARLPFARRPVEKVAVWSYGAYLWNNIAFPILRPMGLAWPVNFAGFALALLPAAVTYSMVEEPFLRIRRMALSALDSRVSKPAAKHVREALPVEASLRG